jgi:hypothetical protein
VIALTLLLSVSPEDAAGAARSTINDPKASSALRRDAFHVLLISGDSDPARDQVIEALRGREPTFQKPALSYLTADSASLARLRDALYLQTESPALAELAAVLSGRDSLAEPSPTLPKAITPDMLRPLLKAADPELAALAGHALALLGGPEGLEALLGHWRRRAAKDQAWDKRVYQAVAHVGDDSKVSALEQIYAGARSAGASSYTDASVIKDLYWSIRGMDGPNARRLRQRIRNEVGMPFLRGEASEPSSS